MTRRLIVNADDFGQTGGITRGIVDCHRNGIVTSTSLMVTGAGLDEAIAMSRDNPKLAIGLHFDVWGEDERQWDTHNISATRDEFNRQLEVFVDRIGRMPTHIDSHRHAHREAHLYPHFLDWVRPLNIPLRGDRRVTFVGGFYGQWEWMVTELQYISVPFLQEMLRNEVRPGCTEFSCHPGYLTPDYKGVYSREREVEIETLTNPLVRRTIETEHIELISYADYDPAMTASVCDATPCSDTATQGRST